MTTITKERLQWLANISGRDDIDDIDGGEIRELAFIALASLEAEPVMFCISGQNVDSEEHVSTSKAVVDAWVEEWNQVDGSPGEPLYKTMPLYALPAPVVPEGLVKAVRFYEQVKNENPPVGTGAWKDAVDWVLEEACLAVITGIKGENDTGIKD
ncbi:TPA: hypothetical protein SO392_004974 [Escherichia coli]|uniref:hypothetical protein n=1 Tax=Escherichia coli TaxID=562 RepID=UPI000854B567|nr:hypothetical protein [Escherichia coli]OEL85473.1 hypothetical protein BHF13_09005 [Escherichia coli]HEK5774980.1 hypothetical protein [Escherichia coli]HEK5779982.1 hypothetical protein [Escherichia coli]HEK5784945.1 hypothetical protein [Escherichia coli]HEK5889136.1 hypothetical protein [Escherichia coli]